MKFLLALLASVSVSMAQIPITILNGPDSPPSLTRKDFEEASKFLQGALKFFTFLSEVTDSSSASSSPVILEPTIAKALPSTAARDFDIKAENLEQLLRSLARLAKMNLVVEPGMNRAVTFRIENKSPREMIDILCVAEQLQMDELNGVSYIKHSDGPPIPPGVAMSTKVMLDAYLAKGFTRAESIQLLARFPDGFSRGFAQALAEREKAGQESSSRFSAPARLFQSSSKKQSAPPSKNKRKKPAPQQRRVFEVDGDDLATTLRALGREAQMDLFIHADVKGTVNLRLEDKTAREVIEVIVQANELLIDEVNGVHFVQTVKSTRKLAAERTAHPAKVIFDAYRAEGFSREEALELMVRAPGGASFLHSAVSY
jgi:hypothetical protein